jgi:hyperosmotically inducible protein
MKVRTFIGAMAVAGLGFTPQLALAQASSTAGATTAKVDDSALKSRIETRLKNSASLKGDDIAVDVSNGVVTLTGTVQSEAQSVRARSLAKVAGVTNVENKLTVDSKSTRAMDKAGDKTSAAMDKAGDKTDRAMDKAGAKTEHAGDKSASTAQKAGSKTEKVLEKAGIRIENDDKAGAKTGTTGTTAKPATTKGKDDVIDVDANINDAWITTKVKSNFVNEDALKGSDINVDTNNHVVTLKGTVATAAGRARAVALAKSTKGVTRVVDALTIGPSK